MLKLRADPHIRCRWTHMTALHYASYFDVAPVLKLLFTTCSGNDPNQTRHRKYSNFSEKTSYFSIEQFKVLFISLYNNRTHFSWDKGGIQYQVTWHVLVTQLLTYKCDTSTQCVVPDSDYHVSIIYLLPFIVMCGIIHTYTKHVKHAAEDVTPTREWQYSHYHRIWSLRNNPFDSHVYIVKEVWILSHLGLKYKNDSKGHD